MANKRRETVSRSISFNKKLDDKIVDLSERLFQENVSATIGYILSKYFDDIENGIAEQSKPIASTTTIKPKAKNIDISFME